MSNPVIEKFDTLLPRPGAGKRILKSKLLTALGATGVLLPFPANPERIIERKILLQNAFNTNASGGGGGGGTCTTGTTVATDWATRVVANGGAAPSAATQSAIADFVCGCITDGIWSKMLAVGVIAPDNITAALTPLLVGPGLDPWTAPGGGITHSINGLKGHTPSGSFVRTGVKNTDYTSAQDGGVSWYCYDATTTGFDGGSYNEVKGILFAAKHSDGFAYGYHGTTAASVNEIKVASPGNGFYSNIRVTSTDHRLFFANSLNPHAEIGSNANAWAGTFLDNGDGMILFAINDILGSQQLHSNDTISFMAWYQGSFSATDSANLFARAQTLRTAFGGGFR